MKQNFFSSGRWKDWFSFSRRERSGILILLSLIIAETFVLFYLHYTETRHIANNDFTEFQKQADEFFASAGQATKSENNESFSSIAEEEFDKGNSLFYFDPNKASEGELRKLGLSDRVASTIINYRSKGGSFTTKEDFKKIYGLRLNDYLRLESFIVITDPGRTSGVLSGEWVKKSDRKKKAFNKIDVSVADTLELTRIQGVGEVFARRIYKYRISLGGFYSINQLHEVYGMSDSLFQVILPQVELSDSSIIDQLNINKADYEVLARHPYIDGKLASLIVNYRRQHGAFAGINEVRAMPLVNEELYRKLAPYLKAE